MTDDEFAREADAIERRCLAIVERVRRQLADAEALLLDVRCRRAVDKMIRELEDDT